MAEDRFGRDQGEVNKEKLFDGESLYFRRNIEY
jgi:hypothetical protein